MAKKRQIRNGMSELGAWEGAQEKLMKMGGGTCFRVLNQEVGAGP